LPQIGPVMREAGALPFKQLRRISNSVDSFDAVGDR